MLTKTTGVLTRRSLLKSTAATSAALVSGIGGVSLFNVNRAFADMMNPADVLKTINVGKYVKKEYREQYKLGDNDELWQDDGGGTLHRDAPSSERVTRRSVSRPVLRSVSRRRTSSRRRSVISATTAPVSCDDRS